MYPVTVILALQKFIGHGFYSINTTLHHQSYRILIEKNQV